MAKYRNNPISQNDIIDYLNENSDFSFEIKVFRELHELGLDCAHGGVYDDPITGLSREFDIRGLYDHGSTVRCSLSIECKNLQEYFPLVIHCLRRRPNESYNQLVHTQSSVNGFSVPARSHKITTHSLYKRGEYVGKYTDQVGRNNAGAITTTDRETYDKISQAVNSAKDLITQAYVTKDQESYTLVFPVVVVPDNTLWQITYSDEGEIESGPSKASHISLFIGKKWQADAPFQPPSSYTISHLEVITFSEITQFIRNYLGNYIDYCQSLIFQNRELW